MFYNVNSIQHLGIGTADNPGSWKWYRKFFGMDIPFFDSEAEAPLMKHYTKNEVINKRASMIMNLQGGCAMEVVEPYSFESSPYSFETSLGDIGIYIGTIKSKDVQKHFELFQKEEPSALQSEIVKDPLGRDTFYVKDPNGLLFQILPGNSFYTNTGHVSASNLGCTMGVTNVDKSAELYGLLGYDKVVFNEEGVFEDWKSLKGGENRFRRMILTQSKPTGGGFAKAIADTYIELVQVLDREPKKLWTGRIWGDTGFVHLGFDVKGMKALGENLEKHGYPFTCDSSNELFMGKTRIHSTYIDDPDGILLELIEVYKIPIIEKWGVFLNVEKRDPLKPLPDLMLKALKFNRVKD